MLVTLLRWSESAVPAVTDTALVAEAAELLRFLFSHARHDSGPVLRNNITIIKLFIEKWT